MATMLEIVSDAFEEISVKTAEIPLTSDELQAGIRRCNDMLLDWQEDGVIFNYTPVVYGEDRLNLPRSALRAVKKNLAVDLAPSFQAIVSPALAVAADNTFNSLLSSAIDLSCIEYPDTLPIGSGNECGTWYTDIFFTGDNCPPEPVSDFAINNARYNLLSLDFAKTITELNA